MSEGRAGDGRVANDDLGRRLANDMLEVGRQELARLREDLVGQPRPALTGLVLVAAAAGSAVMAAASATAAALRLLELVLPRRLAALALTAGYAGGSIVLLRQALQKLDAAGGGSQRLARQVRQVMPS
ncbi:MAG: phage holin family protein [Micromonosporaceae bacterium]|jgi:hypothetical protein|nr:phage holin family protein [Micromonosporaceae bacterium]